MTTPDHHSQPPPVCVPKCVPVCVPNARQGPGESSASLVPSPYGRDALSEPSASASPKRVPHTTWTYPVNNHPATLDFPRAAHTRTVPCPHCGAPPTAHCATKTGNTTAPHKDRRRALDLMESRDVR